MKVFGRMFLLAGMVSGIFLPGLSPAGDGWEASITAGASTAENRLSFGQKANATDGPDGAYDVPAMLNGDIKASFKASDGRAYWRDIKASGDMKTWNLVIESHLDKSTVVLKWKPSAIGAGKAFLLDDSGRVLADMKKESAYSYVNEGQRSLSIKIINQ